MNCGKCKYWFAIEASTFGECRKNPPAIIKVDGSHCYGSFVRIHNGKGPCSFFEERINAEQTNKTSVAIRTRVKRGKRTEG